MGVVFAAALHHPASLCHGSHHCSVVPRLLDRPVAVPSHRADEHTTAVASKSQGSTRRHQCEIPRCSVSTSQRAPFQAQARADSNGTVCRGFQARTAPVARERRIDEHDGAVDRTAPFPVLSGAIVYDCSTRVWLLAITGVAGADLPSCADVPTPGLPATVLSQPFV